MHLCLILLLSYNYCGLIITIKRIFYISITNGRSSTTQNGRPYQNLYLAVPGAHAGQGYVYHCRTWPTIYSRPTITNINDIDWCAGIAARASALRMLTSARRNAV